MSSKQSQRFKQTVNNWCSLYKEWGREREGKMKLWSDFMIVSNIVLLQDIDPIN